MLKICIILENNNLRKINITIFYNAINLSNLLLTILWVTYSNTITIKRQIIFPTLCRRDS